MPHFKFTTGSPETTKIHYYWEAAAEGIESATTNEPHTSCPHETDYQMLPHSLRSCLDYCALLRSMFPDYWLEKERIVRLMVAEGLIEENVSEVGSCLEDVASSFIDQLAGRGMLLQRFNPYHFIMLIEIPPEYYRLCVVSVDEEDFISRNAHTPIRVFVHYYHDTVFPSLENLKIQSLFFTNQHVFSNQAIVDAISGLRSLLVLEWEGWADDHISFSKIGDLINLKLLNLVALDSSQSNEITRSLSNSQHLQTLELYPEFNKKVLEGVASVETLRHLSCFEFRLPKGIRRLVNLQTLVSWDARSEFMEELSSLNQLQRINVCHVADENINKLFDTIASLKKLKSLSMTAHKYRIEEYGQIFPLLEPFLPPPHIEELRLEGTLMELPDWFNSLKNLTSLTLKNSHLADYSSTIFQFFPKLKFLCLDSAYNTEFIGKEFCNERGFPKLEILEIRSTFLVVWTEIGDGAFPNLTSLTCYSPSLRFFPEGVKNISKLEILELVVHKDLIRRLEGDENYKIKHIPSVFMH